MITPKVASRSDWSDFRMAFQLACMRAAASSSPTIRGSTTIVAAGSGARFIVRVFDGHAHMHGGVADLGLFVGAQQTWKPVLAADLRPLLQETHRRDRQGAAATADPDDGIVDLA